MVGWVVGWLRNAGNKANLSPASAGTWAELGNLPNQIVAAVQVKSVSHYVIFIKVL